MSSQRRDPRAAKMLCAHCGQELEDDEVYELDGAILCWDCFNEEEDLRGIEEEWVE
jgi:NMD protein affecting ribosome stability and mRNA decay